jgi:predicted alpha/beta superfamily hydrolase
MKTTKLFILTCALSLNTVYAQENNVNDDTQKAYEMPRTQVIPINNSETKAQDTLYIKLPEGYEESNDIEYPVIYFTHPEQHIEILSATTENLIEDVISVGITFQKGMTFRTVDSYMNFIRNDVFKTVENSYRADADRRTYFGYSSGALVGAYILSKHPNAFKNFILGSPALGADSTVTQKIYEFGSNTANERKKLNSNVFVSYGTSEKETDKQHFEEFITILENLNDESLTFEHIVVEGNHQTAFPATTLRSVTWLASLLKDGDFPVLEGPYFGQKPPGLIPEVFAPGIVSLKERVQGSVSFSPDLDEMYFSAKKKSENWTGTVYFSRLENKKWTDLKKVNFTKGKSSAEGSPFVSPSGKRIYFLDDNNKIWYVNRFEDSWSDAIKLDLPINDDDVIFSPNEAKNGDLYYFNMSKFKLYYAPNKNGEFSEVREVDIEFGVHNFISPSQDFLLVDDRDHHEDETRKDNDIYVYFKKKDGTWTKPINLGKEVNSNFSETSPRITPDGKYLFFSRYNEDGVSNIIYWVSTEIIEKLRPK